MKPTDPTVEVFLSMFAKQFPAPTPSLDRRPVFVVAGTYREYLRFARDHALRDLIDVRFVAHPERLHGCPTGDPVLLLGSYIARRDWAEIKQALDSYRAVLIYPETELEDEA